ncbi:hypothetical protein PoB_006410800 [Plakobranchus ocellatus]|uniref:Uncharacterized protein n=1 Tax=Plakobranchus ocellatus TaxID=259542 RepID=A0AAV4D085_9GAST|nr:hypothetical protein PoB_006410800 [Plakobranchus ocellatus]
MFPQEEVRQCFFRKGCASDDLYQEQCRYDYRGKYCHIMESTDLSYSPDEKAGHARTPILTLLCPIIRVRGNPRDVITFRLFFCCGVGGNPLESSGDYSSVCKPLNNQIINEVFSRLVEWCLQLTRVQYTLRKLIDISKVRNLILEQLCAQELPAPTFCTSSSRMKTMHQLI